MLIIANIACILINLSKCAQLSTSGLESSSLYAKMLLLYLDLTFLATPVDALDILELFCLPYLILSFCSCPFFKDFAILLFYFLILDYFYYFDFEFLEVIDFFPFINRENINQSFSSFSSSSSSSSSISISIKMSDAEYSWFRIQFLSFSFLKYHSANSMYTSTISTEFSFFKISIALLYAQYCLYIALDALASLIQTFGFIKIL